MALFDMFDKIDDIIYEPVKAVADWIKEPLKSFEHKREMASSEQAAEIEKQRLETAAEVGMRKEREKAALGADIRRWNSEIDKMVSEQEQARQDKLVESVKRYQIELATASRDIVNSIGLMSLELRERANALVLEKTRSYKELQDEAKKQSMLELKEAKEMFGDDPETYKLLLHNIISERSSMVDMAGKFILELSEDIKRLNKNTDELMRLGMETTNSYLKPMAESLGISSSSVNLRQIEDRRDKNIIEADYSTVK